MQYHQQAPRQQSFAPKAVVANTNSKPIALPYTTTTVEAIERYSFVSVFPTTDDIQGGAEDQQHQHNHNEQQQSAAVPHHHPHQELMKPSKGQVPWCCIECDAETFGHKCTSCGRPRETGALRVFVGKLNREGSAEMTHAMLQALCAPSQRLSGPVLHVEPHTHASNGRGKGCTWIYVRCARDVKTIVDALHHRTFVAVHPVSGEVGFVPFPATCDEAEIEGVFQFDHDNRQRFVHYLLHRGRVTAEIPESMQQDVFAKLNGTFVGKIQKQRQQQFLENQNQQQQQQPKMMNMNMNMNMHMNMNNNNDFVEVIKPPMNVSHTHQMMHYVQQQAPAYSNTMINMLAKSGAIPAGFQQRVTLQVPLPPRPYQAPVHHLQLNNNNNNHNNFGMMQQQQQLPQLPPPPFASYNNHNNNNAAVSHQQQEQQFNNNNNATASTVAETSVPPRPELATASWYQEEDQEDNDFEEEVEEQQNDEDEESEGRTTPSKKTTCKRVCNNGKRYMWNPY